MARSSRLVYGSIAAGALTLISAGFVAGRVADDRAEDAAGDVLASLRVDADASIAELAGGPCGAPAIEVPFEGDPVVRRQVVRSFSLDLAEVEVATSVPAAVNDAVAPDIAARTVGELFVRTEIFVELERVGDVWCRRVTTTGASLVGPGGVDYLDAVATIEEITGVARGGDETELDYLSRLLESDEVGLDDDDRLVIDHLRRLSAPS